MLFTDLFFLYCFLPVLLALYFTLGKWTANLVLVVAGVVFYVFGEHAFVAVLAGCAAFNYLVGLALSGARDTRLEKGVLWFGVAGNLGVLVFFKYFNFIVENTSPFFHMAGVKPPLHMVTHVPLGISFFTFHAITYIVDIYRRRIEPRKNPLTVALYFFLFPQIVAGPIVRYREIAEQLVRRRVTREGFAAGVARFIAGLAKKKLIADNLAVVSDSVFATHASQLTTGSAWLGAVCYMLQIYFDFSGYSDMAIGLGRMFGFQLPENFNHPYISRSVTEFWKRWHMTLSAWFRDYVYIPLGGNRLSRARLYLNLLVVFLLCGFWHGAEWKFVAWGMYHGVFLILERMGLSRFLKACPRPVGHIYALLAIMVGWVIFRADSLQRTFDMLSAMAGFSSGNGSLYRAAIYLDNGAMIVLAAAIVCCLPVVPVLSRWRAGMIAGSGGKRAFVPHVAGPAAKYVFLAMIYLLSAMAIASGTYRPFLYFRF